LILQCLDGPVENALGFVKIGGKIGEGIIGYFDPNELDLSFPTSDDYVEFHQIPFKTATVGAMTDRHTDRQTDRGQRSYNLAHAML